jgi:ketosteroid isomerase-like protein
LIDAFPDLTNEVNHIWQDPIAKTTFVDVYIGGTQRKDAFGIPNKGKKYWLRHLFILEMNDAGKITKMTTFWDSATWYQQLGKTQLP